jgi:hypothetical protein
VLLPPTPMPAPAPPRKLCWAEERARAEEGSRESAPVRDAAAPSRERPLWDADIRPLRHAAGKVLDQGLNGLILLGLGSRTSFPSRLSAVD